jgi:integrase
MQKKILKKHEDAENGEYCFEVFQNPVMNRYLKEIGEIVEINDRTTLTSFRGGQKIEDTQPKYKFITCHTARRTFITLSLQKGIRQEVVMRIAGQKDIRTMMKYVKLVEDVLGDEMGKAWG